MTIRRVASFAALALAACILLTGCGPANAGSAASDDFEKYMGGEPGVADVQVQASNDLPFQGSASGLVVLDEGADDNTLTVVVDRMAAYLRDHPFRVSWRLRVSVDGFTLGVLDAEDTNRATIVLLRDAREVGGIVGGSLDSGGGGLNSFVVSDPALFITALGELVQLDFTSAVQAGDEAGTFSVMSTDDVELPAAEIAAFDAVAAAYSVTSAQLAPGSVALRVGADSEVVGATQLAESLPGSAAIEFAISGGIVTREGEGDFTHVNAIIESLLDVPGLTAIGAKADVLRLEVSGTAPLIKLDALVAAGDPGATLTVYYLSDAAVSPRFSIYGPAERRGSYIPIVIEMLAGGYVDGVEILADRIDIVAGAYSADRMTDLAATLKRLLPTGEQVRLTNAEGGVNFTFRVDDLIDVPSDESYGEVDAETFVDDWNALP